jgi:hypothetical protein
MYTIINSEFIKWDEEIQKFRVDIVVDSESDIPEPKDKWYVGSTVFITETHTIRILNNKGAWE